MGKQFPALSECFRGAHCTQHCPEQIGQFGVTLITESLHSRKQEGHCHDEQWPVGLFSFLMGSWPLTALSASESDLNTFVSDVLAMPVYPLVCLFS